MRICQIWHLRQGVKLQQIHVKSMDGFNYLKQRSNKQRQISVTNKTMKSTKPHHVSPKTVPQTRIFHRPESSIDQKVPQTRIYLKSLSVKSVNIPIPILCIVYLINNNYKTHIVKGCRLRFIYMYSVDATPRLSSSLLAFSFAQWFCNRKWGRG